MTQQKVWLTRHDFYEVLKMARRLMINVEDRQTQVAIFEGWKEVGTILLTPAEAKAMNKLLFKIGIAISEAYR